MHSAARAAGEGVAHREKVWMMVTSCGYVSCVRTWWMSSASMDSARGRSASRHAALRPTSVSSTSSWSSLG